MSPRASWYFDADTVGLGKMLRDARSDVTWPGDDGQRLKPRLCLPPCVIQDKDTDDEIWIPHVTTAGLAIITRDKKIQTRTREINAVYAAGARMFAITSEENLNRWGLLEVFVPNFRAIEEAARQPGPYVYSVTRTGIRNLDIFESR